MQIFSRETPKQFGDFYAANIVATRLVRATFHDQNMIAIVKFGNFLRSSQISVEISLHPCHEDAETRQRNLVGNAARNLVKNLTVRYHQRRANV